MPGGQSGLRCGQGTPAGRSRSRNLRKTQALEFLRPVFALPGAL
jgi:hypothetical protein